MMKRLSSSNPPIINCMLPETFKMGSCSTGPRRKNKQGQGLTTTCPMGKNASGKKKKGSCQNFCSTVVLLGRTGKNKNPLLWRGTIFAIQFSVPPSTRYKRVSSSMSENYLSTRRTAKKDGKSIINRVTFVADKIGKVSNWYYLALHLL